MQQLDTQINRVPLAFLAHSLGISGQGRAHRAMSDVLLTRAVFNRIVDDLRQQGAPSVRDVLRAQGGVRSQQDEPLNLPGPLQEALQEGSSLWLLYESAHGERTRRLVRPIMVSQRRGRAYLVAYCHLRAAERSFRLDRIIAMERPPSKDDQ